MVKMRKGSSDRGVLHVTLLCCLCKGRDGSSELGLMKGLLCVTGLLEIDGGVSHCQSLQVTVCPETAGTATANLCRLQNLHRQLVQLLPNSAGNSTTRHSWYNHCQPLQVTEPPNTGGTAIVNIQRLLVQLLSINRKQSL
jgi:hypothetical protein